LQSLAVTFTWYSRLGPNAHYVQVSSVFWQQTTSTLYYIAYATKCMLSAVDVDSGMSVMCTESR